MGKIDLQTRGFQFKFYPWKDSYSLW